MNIKDAQKLLLKYWFVPVVIAIFLVSFTTRLQPMKVGDITGLDEFYFLRICQDMANGGFTQPNYEFTKPPVNSFTLPDLDMMRHHPFGARIRMIEPPVVFYLPVLVYKALQAVGWNQTFLYFAMWFPAFMGALATAAMFFVGRELYGNRGGVISALISATVLGFIGRTTAGAFEKEAFAAIFIVMSLYFFIKGVRTMRLRDGVMAGLSLMMLNMIWGGAAYFIAAYAAFLFFHAVFKKGKGSLFKLYVPTYVIGILISQVMPAVVRPNQSTAMLLLGAMVICMVREAAEGFRLNLRWKTIEFNGIKDSQLPFITPATALFILIAFLMATMFNDTASALLAVIIDTLFVNQATAASTVAEQIPGNWNDLVSSTSVQPAGAIFPQLSFLFPAFGMSIFLLAGMATLCYEFFRTRKTILLLPIIVGILSIWGVHFMIRLLYVLGFALPIVAAHVFTRGIERAEKVKVMKSDDITGKILMATGGVFFLAGLACISAQVASTVLLVFMGLPMMLAGYMLKESEWKFKLNLLYIPIVIYLVFLAAFSMASAYAYAGQVGEIYNSYWGEAMEYLSTKTPVDGTNVISWWDFGYWFQTEGHRPSVSDGGGVGPRDQIAWWFVDNPANWTNREPWLLGKYQVTHILMDYTLPGKYGAISKIASDGKKIVGFLEFGRNPVNQYQKGNITIYEFRAGDYAIWLPLNQDGSIAERPVFLVMQNGQYSGKAYIEDVCTSAGIITMPGSEQQTMKGCVTVAPWAVYYVPPEAEHTIFTSLMFMDGYGLPVKKVFDNGLVHIFETSLVYNSSTAKTSNPALSPLVTPAA